MCFSASASFLASVPLSAVGVATLRKTKTKSEIPFAAFPVLFAIQQFIEGTVWLSFMYNFTMLQTIATYAFAGFAYVLWPIATPIAVRLIEPEGWRKNVLSVLVSIGAICGLYLLYCIVRFPVTSRIAHDSIRYSFSNPFSEQSIWAYLIAVCVSFLISSHKFIKMFGFVIIASLTLTYFFYTSYVVSVWCFFAAILSGMIYFFFASRKSSEQKSI
jgi:hypothetical protein